MLSHEAMLAFASTLDESITHVNHYCVQIMNAVTVLNDDDDDDVDTIMLFTLIHKLTCITTTLLLEISIKQVNMSVI